MYINMILAGRCRRYPSENPRHDRKKRNRNHSGNLTQHKICNIIVYKAQIVNRSAQKVVQVPGKHINQYIIRIMKQPFFTFRPSHRRQKWATASRAPLARVSGNRGNDESLHGRFEGSRVRIDGHGLFLPKSPRPIGPLK